MRRSIVGMCAALALAVVMGCGNTTDTGGGDGGSDLSGKVEADGSSTVFLVSQAVSVAFNKPYPKVQVTVGKTGTGGGFKRFVLGETDISDASRPISPDEFKQCQTNKVSFIELPIAYDGLSFVVNPKNTFVESLTIEDLQRIYLKDNAAKTWKDLNSDWPAQTIQVYAPGKNSGTYDYFMEVVGKRKEIRTDISTNEDDNPLVQGVASDEYATGFFGYAYYVANKDKLRVVPIVNPQTKKAVEPSTATIESGEYAPFSRPLFIYVNANSLKQPQVKKFVEYYLEHAAEMSKKVGYVSLPDKVYDTAKAHFQERLPGTCYVTESGEERHGSVTDVFKKENLRDTK